MEYIKEINLFNGLSNKLNLKKESVPSTPYKSQKYSQKLDKNISNLQDISTKEEDSSTTTTVSKLPKIHKHLTSINLNLFKENFILSKSNNNIKDTIDIKIEKESNLSLTNTKTNKNSSTIVNSSKNKYYLINSSHSIYYNHNFINFKKSNSLIPPADPLLKRTIVPKVNPKFGKMKAHVNLPEFKGEEPLTKFEYKTVLKDNIIKNITIEKQYEVSLYVNSSKMLNNLVYLKTKLNKEGQIILENLINVKKLNRNDNNESDEEDNDKDNENENEEEQPLSDTIENNNKNGENNKINSFKNINNDDKLLKNISSLEINRPKTVFGDKLKPYYKLKNKNDKTLIFESRFESGNLLCAFKTEDENSYQLYLQNDTNTTGYIQWFFFRVSNTKKGRKVNFNIINNLRKKCIYSKGLKIMTYSTLTASKENIGWHRAGTNVMYYANNLYVFNSNNGTRRNLHSLSFDYEFKYDNDVVYFANCIPYFYSKLMKELNYYELNEEKYPYFQRKTIATTLGGNDLDMFTINSMYDIYNKGPTSVILPKSKNNNYSNNNNNNNNNSQVVDERQAVILIARQHPGETVGSHVMQGCIDFLMGNSEEAKKLREIYLFKIVPMMNPDGVLVGNSRTSFAGCDLNRRWTRPSEIIHPEVYFTKNMILKLTLQRNIAFIIDCHGHFGTFNSLFYCNYKDDNKTCKLFPYLCSHLSKIISFQQSTFAMPRFKINTERIALFNELDDDDNDNVVALETSFFGINKNGEYNKTYFNSKLMNEVGRDICLGMLSYYYKCKNIDIEFNFFGNKDNAKKLDVDMREFESEIIKEVAEEEEDNNNNEVNEEKSESEPSVDNLDKNQIMRLLPGNGKRRRRRKKNKKYDKKKDKNKDINIELFNPLKEAARKLEEEKKKKLVAAKIVINCHNNRVNVQNVNNNIKHEYTQTEEIFFKKHWSYFAGQYKIIDCAPRLIMNSKNYYGFSANFFGHLRNRNNINQRNAIKRYSYDKNKENLNDENHNSVRQQNFNNKNIFNQRNSKKLYENNKIINNKYNINNILNASQKNNDNKIINRNNNNNNKNKKNNLTSSLKDGSDKNKLNYIAKNYSLKESNKSSSNDNKNYFNKTSGYFSNLFKDKSRYNN